METCACREISGAEVLIFACSGASNLGETVDLAARRLRDKGVGSLSCLAALVAGLEQFVERAGRADRNVVLDGCPTDCAGKVFERLALPNVMHVRATDLGLGKARLGTRATEDDVARIVEHLTRRLSS